jgi:2-oxoglutarate ferredoxin oxidoreductase subunit delta
MSRVVFLEERCKGCLLCTQVCPTEILVQSDRFNKQGYKVVCVKNGDMEGCKGCAFCAEICPDEAIIVYRTKKSSEESENLEEANG